MISVCKWEVQVLNCMQFSTLIELYHSSRVIAHLVFLFHILKETRINLCCNACNTNKNILDYCYNVIILWPCAL